MGVVGYLGLFFLASKGVLPINVVPGARTLYEGEVGIEPVGFSSIESELKARNIYYRVREDGLEICPRGVGFGPVCFLLTQNTIKASQDIPGVPDKEKYKEEVREDVGRIGNILRIKENSWKITKTEYPFTAAY